MKGFALEALVYLFDACIIMAFAACTDAERSDWLSLARPHAIECYSGGQQVYRAESTGKVLSHNGGSYSFEDADTRQYVTVTMDCVITVLPRAAR